jgi:dGTPase
MVAGAPDATISIVMESFTPRERTEELERGSLSTWASLATETKGRDRYEDPDPLRTAYQQDGERIVSSAAFARLASTTGGLPLPGAKSLLAHTEIVVQASRILARALGLNEDLTQAVALGRELGQPPFGRAGQIALGGLVGARFEPGEQALRIVEGAVTGVGLNLTFEARDGIVQRGVEQPATLEGQVVASVATFHALSEELDQALAAGVVHTADIPTPVRMLGADAAQRLRALVDDVVESSAGQPHPAGSEMLATARTALATWISERIDADPDVLAGAERVVHCLRSITVYELEQGGLAPTDVVDRICALTDAEARRRFEELFLPDPQLP